MLAEGMPKVSQVVPRKNDATREEAVFLVRLATALARRPFPAVLLEGIC